MTHLSGKNIQVARMVFIELFPLEYIQSGWKVMIGMY